MVKLETSKGDVFVEFQYDVEHGVTFSRLLKKEEGVENSYELLTEGYAILADADKWNRYTGRKYALARAMKAGGFEREDRTKMWEQFFSQCRTV